MKKYELIAENILKYLKENGPANANVIKAALIDSNPELFSAKSTYYDALNYLVKQGSIEHFEKNGDIKLNFSNGELQETLKKTDVDNWLILFILENEKRPMTVNQIKNNCYSEETIDIDDRLTHLQNEGLVIKSKNSCSENVYSPTQSSLFFLTTNYDKMMEYARIYQILGAETVFENFANRLKSITGILSGISEDTQGKSNILRNKSIGCMAELMTLPYKNYCIAFTIGPDTKQLNIGSILYSEDANEFYILGQRGKRRDPEIIPLSSIDSMSVTKVKNTVFENAFYQEYVSEMFEVEPGEKFEVEIHFRLTPDNKRKLEQLHANRVNSKITIYTNEKTIIYKDTIRGKSKFKRFLRSFGSDAIVVSPEDLKNEMIQSADRTINLYS